MKKLLAMLVILALTLGGMPAAAAPSARPDSDPISHGTINKVTYLRWGKSEAFPTLALVGPGQEFDVYEYDRNWVMVLYDTWVSQGMSGGGAQSFYCYVKRADITCDPALEGDESAKADTGPGKRKGKKPRPKPSAAASQAPASEAPTAEGTTEPQPTVEEQEEYDWIIRTPGMCNVTVHVENMDFTCSFALMAQKAGGTAPSSDPTYNRGMHTPYAATASYGMVAPMQSLIENMGEASKYLVGSGGVEITGSTAGSTFFLDTGASDPALVNFTLNMQGTGTLNPTITDGNLTGHFESTFNMPLKLPVQLKKSGSGYQFILVGMKPGGGDLKFPAVLEKAFADPDRWDKEAQKEDKRREEAERLRKELLEKIKKQMQDEYNKQQDASRDESQKTDPMTAEGEDGEDIELAPLVTPAPLTDDDKLATLAPEDDNPPIVPLVPSPGENADGFPAGK